MPQPSVFVIILNYNGKDTLLDCLSSVYNSDYPNMNVVVVDNFSTDGSFEQAKEKFSKAHFISNSLNMGFAKGNNLGIRFALEKFADYIFLLNNDAEIFSDTLSLLVSSAEKTPSFGIISPMILGSDQKTPWFAGGKINWLQMSCVHYPGVAEQNIYPTEYASGCAMLINKSVFRKIGLFDERFFLYYEDADFSFRASKSNFKIMLLPTAKAIHYEKSNRQNLQKTYWLVLSALIFFKSNASLFYKIWYFFYVPARRIKARFSTDPFSPQVRKAFRDFKKVPK
jgi:GT2 family glycosyltransferase